MNNMYYVLNCDECEWIWESDDGFPKYCPHCGEPIKDRIVNFQEKVKIPSLWELLKHEN